MTTNYERLATQEGDVRPFMSTTSLLPLGIEEDGDLKRPSPFSRLRAIKRIPRLGLYFLALVLGTITMVSVLTFSPGIKAPELWRTMTMDDAFDGSQSPRRHMIEWLPQCGFSLNDFFEPLNRNVMFSGGDDAYGTVEGGNLVLVRLLTNSSGVLLSKDDLVYVSRIAST